MRLVVDCRFVTPSDDDAVSMTTRGLVSALGVVHPLTMLISDHRQRDVLPPLPWQLLRAADDVRDLVTPFGLNEAGVDVLFSPVPVWSTLGRRYGLVVGSAAPTHPDVYSGVGGRMLRPLRPVFHRLLQRGADAVVAVAGAGQRDAVTATRPGQAIIRLDPHNVLSPSGSDWSEHTDQLMALFYEVHRERRSRARSDNQR
ncbi:hypothetical protein [Paramicrobacterium chengjingii]|uniref:Uncharacterized protein n=1 Tax=Paramicrobacterium chengjingii TaxID=2769067 RepID=A0ABX6YM94_9MICO|nr:hypothetical protein [Microbacterium chengjingii]QPZ39922.1 hypothetical protein HCR76_07880 [Microbacterium chengjingii]